MKQTHSHNQAIGTMAVDTGKQVRKQNPVHMDMMPVFITDYISMSFPNTGNKDLSKGQPMKTSQQPRRK
ncbi:hypothetical protein [Sediminibacterium ginsengisoli]|uniref:Uncharacterized protein n=1 Tax=Sediminibacterium ginsengisoli TaxID=413434 RepID=A0A1T4PZJ9_9BACT|nr:hypothetical protein [Sediminibacterium ginsengisoli]SJZ96943.1 hypothetical protein SAMN04488132_10757 [Sediminibacterium ginsengisoli]